MLLIRLKALHWLYGVLEASCKDRASHHISQLAWVLDQVEVLVAAQLVSKIE